MIVRMIIVNLLASSNPNDDEDDDNEDDHLNRHHHNHNQTMMMMMIALIEKVEGDSTCRRLGEEATCIHFIQSRIAVGGSGKLSHCSTHPVPGTFALHAPSLSYLIITKLQNLYLCYNNTVEW